MRMPPRVVEVGNREDAACAPQGRQARPHGWRDRMAAQTGIARCNCPPAFDAEPTNDQTGAPSTAVRLQGDTESTIPQHRRAGRDDGLLGRHCRLAADEKGAAARNDKTTRQCGAASERPAAHLAVQTLEPVEAGNILAASNGQETARERT